MGIYISNIILYSLVLIFDLKHIKCGGGSGGGGGGGGNIFLAFYAISNISRKNNSGNKKQNIFLFKKTIVDRDNGNLYPMYIVYRKTTIVVLASEPVGGRSRATELPCFRWIDNDPISVLYEFQIDISTNSWEIKYQKYG